MTRELDGDGLVLASAEIAVLEQALLDQRRFDVGVRGVEAQ
ncbi:MAG: hypothetical protein R3D25_10075 [Geminicoccaceae bacterium]